MHTCGSLPSPIKATKSAQYSLGLSFLLPRCWLAFCIPGGGGTCTWKLRGGTGNIPAAAFAAAATAAACPPPLLSAGASAPGTSAAGAAPGGASGSIGASAAGTGGKSATAAAAAAAAAQQGWSMSASCVTRAHVVYHNHRICTQCTHRLRITRRSVYKLYTELNRFPFLCTRASDRSIQTKPRASG
jgi:hypothetical protein